MRVSIFFVGAIATLIAITVKSTYALWFLCSDFVYVILFPQLVSVIFISFSNTYGSACGFIVGFLLRFLSGEPLLDFPAVIPYPTNVPFRTVAMLISFFVLVTVSWVTDRLFRNGTLSAKADIFRCVVNTGPSSYSLDTENKEKSEIPTGEGKMNFAYETGF